MIELQPIVFLLLVELVAGVIGLAVFMRLRARKQQHQENAKAGQLVETFAANLQDRRASLSTSLAPDPLGFPAPAFDVDAAVSAERLFYQSVIELLHEKGSQDWDRLEPAMQRMLTPYCEAISGLQHCCSDLGGRAALVAGLRQDLQLVRQDADALTEQLRKLRLTLSMISAEYADLFAGHAGADELEKSRQRMLAHYHQLAQENPKNLENS